MEQASVHRGVAEQTAVVILAAGKGTRMGRADRAKVCFEIDGRPAINGIIEAFKRRRFRTFVVVVGEYRDRYAVPSRDDRGTSHVAPIHRNQYPQVRYPNEVTNRAECPCIDPMFYRWRVPRTDSNGPCMTSAENVPVRMPPKRRPNDPRDSLSPCRVSHHDTERDR